MAWIQPTYPYAAKPARRSQLSVQPGLQKTVKEINVPKTVNDSAMMAMSSAKKKSSKQADKNIFFKTTKIIVKEWLGPCRLNQQ